MTEWKPIKTAPYGTEQNPRWMLLSEGVSVTLGYRKREGRRVRAYTYMHEPISPVYWHELKCARPGRKPGRSVKR